MKPVSHRFQPKYINSGIIVPMADDSRRFLLSEKEVTLAVQWYARRRLSKTSEIRKEKQLMAAACSAYVERELIRIAAAGNKRRAPK